MPEISVETNSSTVWMSFVLRRRWWWWWLYFSQNKVGGGKQDRSTSAWVFLSGSITYCCPCLNSHASFSNSISVDRSGAFPSIIVNSIIICLQDCNWEQHLLFLFVFVLPDVRWRPDLTDRLNDFAYNIQIKQSHIIGNICSNQKFLKAN